MIKLDDFKVEKQKTYYTCGYSTISMVTSFLGRKVDEEVLLRNFPLGYLGATPAKVIKAFEEYMPEYKMKYRKVSKEKALDIIESKLKAGLPIPFIYLTVNDFNKLLLVSHYSIIIGMDKEKSEFIVANPFGYEEEVSFDELLTKMSFKIKGKMPLILRLSILTGFMRGFMIFDISKT